MKCKPSVPTAPGHSQRKEISPRATVCHYKRNRLKFLKGVSCVTPLSCVKPVINAPNVATNLPVGARLQNFWKNWLDLGAGLDNLTRSHAVISCYGNPHRNLYLLEALHQLIDKNAIELVHSQKSQQQVETYTRPEKSEPLPQGREIQNGDTGNYQDIPPTREWVTSIDFKDAYFHIPIQEQSRKYLRFHVQGQTYQFKALPFGLSTVPMEFTVVAKEVKLMAIHKGIRIHQYLDNWLVRATSHRACLQHTQYLVKMCQELGWLVNVEKSELEPKQVFNFVCYQFDLESGQV